MNNTFTENLLAWFHEHGRHDLPWQQNPTPYRVWISEIMLQQTQVSTVINYYQQFTKYFSSIKLLSEANQDEVLKLWSGLGYYARARHLHRCAQIVSEQYQGHFPQNVEELVALPGIGRSTAGAILSFSMSIRAPILDGNVKRVLTRYHAIEGIAADKIVNQQLWDLALQHTPEKNYAQYNQAIMDLGATVCTRSNPACSRCPVMQHCQAYAQARTHEFPYPKKTTKIRPKKSSRMLIIKNTDGKVLLEKRPPVGIWGGLWSFPECSVDENLQTWCAKYINADIITTQNWPSFNHAFTHFELTIYPVLLTVQFNPASIMEAEHKFWYNVADALPGGIAAPMAKLLNQLKGVL